jgi:transketolase
VMVDHNGGQLDNAAQLHYPFHDLGSSFSSFGWRVLEVDATRVHTVYEALSTFKFGSRDGRPLAIICRATKGHGGFSSFMNSHKVTIPDALLDQEVALQEARRSARVDAFRRYYDALTLDDAGRDMAAALRRHAASMGYEVVLEDGRTTALRTRPPSVRTVKAPARDKRIRYEPESLPALEVGKSYAVDKVVNAAMREFAKDPRVVSIDSDLASTSGLEGGVGFVDKARALNAGVAEANMMLIGEAFGILGYNAWVSTFCPFFDWKILRRIAVGHQERLEVIEAGGWLSEGHGVDLALLATAADLETQANGATHMGNDDAVILAGRRTSRS